MNKSHPRIRFTHSVIVKAPGLLPMLYQPSELAGELNMSVFTLYGWLHAGAPHTQDKHGNLWIDGRAFAGWVEKNRKHPSSKKLENGQAYCLRCKQAVTLIHPRQERIKGKLILIKGECPRCGARINRGGRIDRTFELPAGPEPPQIPE